MTSKEVVTELYKERAYAYENKVCHKGDGWKEAISHYDNIGKCLIQIEKDLEVLEILKTMIRQNEITLTPKEIWNISNKDIEKLKEWLEND